MNNVISFEHAVNGAIERTIVTCLENRGGRWVAEPFLLGMVSTTPKGSVAIMPIINEMVQNGVLETQKVPLTYKMDRNVEGTMYRLIPKPW